MASSLERRALNKIPRHIAAIMDGNGRWAKKRGLPRAMGHQEGVRALHEAVDVCDEIGTKYLTVYAFSTENWFRPKTEVELLMKLMARTTAEERPGLIERNVRVRVIGRTGDLSAELRDQITGLTDATSRNTGLTLTLAISYGGRTEILDACRKAVAGGRAPETDFGALLYDASLPDPDLLIRTGGDRRLSNYLLWQMAYAELYFTETLWPDFRRDAMLAAVEDYGQRQRRFGRVDEE
jgi:undecaprenyl diphosphate synthase